MSNRSRKKKASLLVRLHGLTPQRLMSFCIALFFFSAFALLFLRDHQWQGALLMAVVPLAHILTTEHLPRLFPVDQLLLSLMNFLCGLGILVLYATSPSYAYSQALCYLLGLAAMIACIYVVRIVPICRAAAWVLVVLSLILLILPLIHGEEIHGAQCWFRIGKMSIQTSEFVKLLLLIALSRFLADRRTLACVFFLAGCLLILLFQKDLGMALLYYSVTLMLYFAASGNLWLTGLGVLGGVGASVAGYQMFAHVKRRVAAWLDPWADYEGSGYQLVQNLMAIASGGLLGVGLGLGSPLTIPAYHTDCIFIVICEQFGMLFGLVVLLMYAAIIWRGTSTAMAARRRYHGLLAMGCTLMLGLQTFLIIGGVIKLIPLTGVTLPFVSHGGSSLISSMALIGLLQGIASINQDDLTAEEALTYLSR